MEKGDDIMAIYTPRTTSPEGLYLPYYMTTASGGVNSAIEGNGAILGANVLNNCVGYSQGRMAEMYNQLNGTTGQNPFTDFKMDAQNWLSAAVSAGMEWGASPKLGAVGVYSTRDGSLGHVVNVEQYANGRWEVSESHYYYDGADNTRGSWDYSYLDSTNYKPAFVANDSDWILLGFIYPDYGHPIVNIPYFVIKKRYNNGKTKKIVIPRRLIK